jgi:hypothetical protein
LFKAKLEIVNIEKEAVEEDPRKIRNQNFIESNLLDLKHEMVILTEDDSHGALQKYFTNHIPDLVVLYPRKQNFIQSLFHKSMTKSMAFHSNAPLMIIH